jgi:hypothetical protein
VCICSCDAETLKSVNVTGKIVLCGASPQGFLDAAFRVAKAGANGLIYGQPNTNNPSSNDKCRGVMPCVLVDFELGHGIRRYIYGPE